MARKAVSHSRGERVETHPGRWRGPRAHPGQHSPPSPRGGVRADEAPGQAREQERDAELHGGEQERVVVGTRVARRGHVLAHVETVRQAPADELGNERKQRERQSGE